MKRPWRRKVNETGDEMDKRTLQEHEEIERRLALLESQVRVLQERAGLLERRRAHA